MQIKCLNVIWILCFAALAAILAGCQTAPSKVEENFGTSVRHMIAVQTEPSAQTGYGLDGNKAELLLERYRTDAAEPESVEDSSGQIEFGDN